MIEIETPATAALRVGDEIPVRLRAGRMFAAEPARA
jgi:hypothetical protein